MQYPLPAEAPDRPTALVVQAPSLLTIKDGFTDMVRDLYISMSRLRGIVIFLELFPILIIICSYPVKAEGLSPALIDRINHATFQLVLTKPSSDPLTYEKPLPLDLLPYQVRTDPYEAIGTAFALGGGRYVTSADALGTAIGNLKGAPLLRDTHGQVHAIDQITQFSLRQDFAVFTLKSQPDGAAPLPINESPQLDQGVYAVANAPGHDIAIREGLYTTTTPEDQDGQWNWLRYTAQNSPSSSGGPLLDLNGKLIGMVLVRPNTDNLNYALPISVILRAPPRLAMLDKRAIYSVNLLHTTEEAQMRQQFALPMSFSDFNSTYLQRVARFAQDQLHQTRERNSSVLFPNGSESDDLLQSSPNLDLFPARISLNSSSSWVLAHARPIRSTFPDRGYLDLAAINGQTMFHLHAPDSNATSQLYLHPDQVMNQILKGWTLTRHVGVDPVRIISLGAPSEQSTYQDSYDRRWQVKIWPVPFSNILIIAMLLPVPDGYVGSLSSVKTDGRDIALTSLQWDADFFDVGYGGTLDQWTHFLAQGELRPASMADVDLSVSDRSQLDFRSKFFSLAYAPSLQPISADSYLVLGFSYIPEQMDSAKRKVQWQVSAFDASATTNSGIDDSSTYVKVVRIPAPGAHASPERRLFWNNLNHRASPFDGVILRKSSQTQITNVLGCIGCSDADALYVAVVGKGGDVPQTIMKLELDFLLKDLKVKER